MSVTNKNEFIEAFKLEFSNSVIDITEDYKPEYDGSSYDVILKGCIDRNALKKSAIPFITANSDFEDWFDLYFVFQGEDKSHAIGMPVNADYGDSAINFVCIVEDKDDIEPITLELESRTFEANDDDNGEGGWFAVYEDDLYLSRVQLSPENRLIKGEHYNAVSSNFTAKVGEALTNKLANSNKLNEHNK